MKYLVLVLKVLMALLLISSGFNHFYKPEFYNPLIPEFLPKLASNYLAGIIELLLGIGLFVKGYEKKAAFGIFLLMIAFLPLHLLDYLKDQPLMGTKTRALFRFLFQFLFIAWGYFLYKKQK